MSELGTSAPHERRESGLSGKQEYDIIFHLHIPKTAGTTLREAFKSHLGQRALVWFPENPHLLEHNIPALAELLRANPQTKVVTGHFVYGVHRALENKTYKYVTVLRHPVDRILSHIVHDIKRNLPKNFESENLLYIGKLLEHLKNPRVGYYYNNLHARYITGILPRDFGNIGLKNVVAEALDNIKKDFIFVGHQRQISDTYRELFSILGLPSDDLKSENIGLKLKSADVFPKQIYEELCDLNRIDLALIDHLFPQIETAKANGSIETFDRIMIDCYRESIVNLIKQNKELIKYSAHLNGILSKRKL